MIPSNNFFIGGGPGDTAASVVAILMVLTAILGIFASSRRFMVIPLLLGALLVPQGNVFVLGGSHLTPVRVLTLAGWAKLLTTGGFYRKTPWTMIDKAVLGWTLVTAVAVSLQWMNLSAVLNQAGSILNTCGIYLLLRQLILTEEDARLAVKMLILVGLVNVLGMVYERMALINLFGVLIGGVQSVPLIRTGRTRAQGVFQHAILAGAYGATMVPLCMWLWNSGKARVIALLGAAAGMVMTLISASSTPIMAFTGSLIAVCLWPIRQNMQILRRGIVVVLLMLQLVMKAPVWYVIARIDVIGGSASFDRAYLIDTCVRHFSDWWLYGTHDTGSWGWSMWDLSNQFVSVAETGGLAALAFFILILVRCYRGIGLARKAFGRDLRGQWSVWFIGAALYAHIMAYFGVSYFDQMQVSWFVLLAMVPVVTGAAITKQVPATVTPAIRMLGHRGRAPWDLVARRWRTL